MRKLPFHFFRLGRRLVWGISLITGRLVLLVMQTIRRKGPPLQYLRLADPANRPIYLLLAARQAGTHVIHNSPHSLTSVPEATIPASSGCVNTNYALADSYQPSAISYQLET